MLTFRWIDFTYYDHPGKYSVVLYTTGCNFKCFGCHNRTLAGWDYKDGKQPIINKNLQASKISLNPADYHKPIPWEEINMAISNEFIDMVIFCGGEFLINPLDKIKQTILKIKHINPYIQIRIDTNWSFPQKVEEIIKRNLIDGFAIDIKGPYRNPKRHPLISQIIWIPLPRAKKVFEDIIKSLKLASQLPESIFRTVKYPVIKDPSYFEEIDQRVNRNLKKTYQQNQFVVV